MKSRRDKIIAAIILILVLFYFFTRKDPLLDSSDSSLTHKQKIALASRPIGEPLSLEDKNDETTSASEAEKIGPLTTEELKNLRTQLKISLSQAYTAQAAFYADFQRYSTDLHFMGFWLGPETKFKLGFLEAFHPEKLATVDGAGEDPLRMTTDEIIRETKDASYASFIKDIDLSDFRHFCKKNCSAGPKGFEVIVVTKLPGQDYDVWLINEEKKILHVKDGTLP